MRAGLGRRVIIPQQAMYLAGFAIRNRPSEGVLLDLWDKALAVQDDTGTTVVFVSTEIIFITKAICDAVAARVLESHGVARENLVFSVTHTHSGPFVDDAFCAMSGLGEDHMQSVKEYSATLVDALTDVIRDALDNLEPAQLWFGKDEATFAVNRRIPTEEGVEAGANPDGPSDHEVPVLKVTSPEGELRAVLFGYACHTTSVTWEHYVFNGDYAGFAQGDIEEAHPGVQAMFVMLCGADQNALPRDTIERSEGYGAQLSAAVERALHGVLQPVRGPLKVAMKSVELDFAPHTRETFESRLNTTESVDPWIERHAKMMIDTYDFGRPICSISYPVQVVSFGDEVITLFLGGEVVVDYQLKLKEKYGSESFFLAGYANDVSCYIPSLRVLHEGGYEGGGSMIYFGLPMPFADDVEDRIMAAVDEAMAKVKSSESARSV